MDYYSNLSPRSLQMCALIKKYQNSTFTQKAFCQQEDLRYSTFTYWLKKYRGYQQTAGVAENVYLFINHRCDRIIKKEYLMTNETPIQVLDKAKRGKTHRGYFWYITIL